MDQLPNFGTSIYPALVPTSTAYAPLHESNRANIESTPREEHEYGSHSRQRLDLYSPNQISDDTPIMVFLHGGGLVSGDKRLPSPPAAEGLMYANLGHYFSSRGFITVIPNYKRTGEGATYPSGGEDLAGVLGWLKTRFSTGSHKLYILGNSAGGVHSVTWFLDERFAESRGAVQEGSLDIQGLILVSIPAHFKSADDNRTPVLSAYYKDRINEDSPLGLLSRAKAPKTRTLVVTGTLDPEDEICKPVDDFVNEWKAQFGEENLDVVVLDGHNHFSTTMGLGTGIDKEESLGSYVLEWIEKS